VAQRRKRSYASRIGESGAQPGTHCGTGATRRTARRPLFQMGIRDGEYLMVWLIKNVRLLCGLPGSPLVNVMGTRICTVPSVVRIRDQGARSPCNSCRTILSAFLEPQTCTPRVTHRKSSEFHSIDPTVARSCAFWAATKFQKTVGPHPAPMPRHRPAQCHKDPYRTRRRINGRRCGQKFGERGNL
jgi:hypothetical protein